MLYKTRGIALKVTDYSDSSVVAHLYTEKYGLQAYLVQGAKKPRAKIHVKQLQPMHLLELVAYHKEGGTLQRLKEAVLHPVLHDVPVNILKSSVAIFLNEVLYKVLRHQNSDPRLFEFVHGSVLWLDRTQGALGNFHLSFLVHLSKFLGFYPAQQQAEAYFDLVEGAYTRIAPPHPNFLDSRQAHLFFQFGKTNYAALQDIRLEKGERKELLIKILDFYRLHTENFGEIKSLPVLEEVFG